MDFELEDGRKFYSQQAKNGKSYIEVDAINDSFKIDEKYRVVNKKKTNVMIVSGLGEAYQTNFYQTLDDKGIEEKWAKRVYIELKKQTK